MISPPTRTAKTNWSLRSAAARWNRREQASHIRLDHRYDRAAVRSRGDHRRHGTTRCNRWLLRFRFQAYPERILMFRPGRGDGASGSSALRNTLLTRAAGLPIGIGAPTLLTPCRSRPYRRRSLLTTGRARLGVVDAQGETVSFLLALRKSPNCCADSADAVLAPLDQLEALDASNCRP